ncbi:MAG: hypothetical protein Q4C77_01690 [Eubacteriales bacterium]|nr:hypothetical protein [Eubacteriales bacterium]
MPVSHRSEEEATPIFTGSSEKEEDTVKSDLEAKLESILSGAEGVGEVRVMLMTGKKENTQGFYSSDETEVTGVLIAAQGADNPVTVQNIQQAVMALFQIEAHKIKIMKMK